MRDREKKNQANKAYYHRNKNSILEKARGKTSSLFAKYNLGKRNAESRGHKWLLTFEEYVSITKENKCNYCGGPLTKTGTNIDRQDNSKDYIVGNSVPCCRQCNLIKGKFLTHSEMLEVIKLLKNLRGTNNLWE